MKENWMRNLKNLLTFPGTQTNERKSDTNPRIQRVEEQKHPKSISEGSLSEDPLDLRYKYIPQELPSLSDLRFPPHQQEKGQIVVSFEKQHMGCKLHSDIYRKTTVAITNYKICIKAAEDKRFQYCPLGKIDRLQKYPGNANEKIWKILITTKNGKKYKLRFDRQAVWKKIYECIELFSFMKNKKKFFAFRHFQFNRDLEDEYQGWKLYNPVKEFQRMKINPLPHTEEHIENPPSDYKILWNKDGKICETYPQILVVPSRISYEQLIGCAKFRSKERIPVLSFAYEYSKGKFACVYRSSQNKVGMKGNRSAEDEKMLKLIGNPRVHPDGKKIGTINCHIYDARGYYAALGNKLQGKGYEMVDVYQNCTLKFLNIPNIHAVRDAYNKMIDASHGEDSRFYQLVGESKWYDYISLILCGALQLAQTLKIGINSLVHCSDGWDRTAQLCTLTSIILDPFYRKIEGLAILIEKQWVYFGHQFGKRLGQGVNSNSEEKSQVFLQFLDCVTQFINQFPNEFQYNKDLITEIAEQAYDHKYGSFLWNNYLEIKKYKADQETVSLWSSILKDKKKYQNKFYMPIKNVLWDLNPNSTNLRIWKEHFLKSTCQFTPFTGSYSFNWDQQTLNSMYETIS